MTPLAIVPLIVLAWLVAAVLWGGEAMLQIRRQTEWDDHCQDALDICSNTDCHMCSDMPIDTDALFLDTHGIEAW